MVVGMVHGHDVGAVGSLTSGGTESVLMAIKAYRYVAVAHLQKGVVCASLLST